MVPFTAIAEMNVGVIDTAYIMAKLPQRDAVAEKLKTEFTGRENELKRLGETIEKERNDFVKNSTTMTETVATNMKRDIQKKMSDFQLKQNAYKEDFARRSREENMKLGNLVKNAVDAVAKRGGYNMLIDRQAVPYIDPSIPELTQQILTELSK